MTLFYSYGSRFGSGSNSSSNSTAVPFSQVAKCFGLGDDTTATTKNDLGIKVAIHYSGFLLNFLDTILFYLRLIYILPA